MEENNDSRFDAFVKEQIKKDGLEQPSLDFTKNVLLQIGEQSTSVVGKGYQPLISKPVWWSLACAFIAIFGYVVFGDFGSEPDKFSVLLFQKIGEFNLLGGLSDIVISNTYVYAFVGLAIFMGVQIYLLKNHFDKRYSMG